MTAPLTVVVPTFGSLSAEPPGSNRSWMALATRAVASAEAQVPKPQVARVHDLSSLARARNTGATVAEGEWLVFLDADDELEPGYVAAVLDGEGDLRYPAVQRYLYGEPLGGPRLYRPRPLLDGNYLVIGTAVRRQAFLDVGGFGDEPLYEDWALFLRLWIAGAEPAHAEGAVYRWHSWAGSRNDRSHAEKVAAEDEIRSRLLPLARQAGRA